MAATEPCGIGERGGGAPGRMSERRGRGGEVTFWIPLVVVRFTSKGVAAHKVRVYSHSDLPRGGVKEGSKKRGRVAASMTRFLAPLETVYRHCSVGLEM